MSAPRTSIAVSDLPSERRRSRRQPHVTDAFVSSPTGGKRIEVVAMDLSRHGVKFSVTQPIASGTYQRLEMGGDFQGVIREVRILSCRPQPDGSFHIHAEFC